ncbi:MAG: gluconate 2-dehydrogenase subunit 3 family protein [Paracoccus sp. (in: a-proteobacteria)]|nr:gluconate 2-dehydrogenase subunit 3 family protein [Paracoccus sp. (in: a-proteobacteria)]
MNRRDLLAMIAAVTGTAMIGGTRAFAYQPTVTGTNIFTDADAAFLDEVAEVILPATDTPGAKDAGVGAFMTQYVSDCYTEAEQQDFRDAIAALEAAAIEAHGAGFETLSSEARIELLNTAAMAARQQAAVVAEARARRQQTLDQQRAADTAGDETTQVTAEEMPRLHWFTPIQQLVLFGFFTSRVGATEVLRYDALPGGYDGDLAYHGEPAWAT